MRRFLVLTVIAFLGLHVELLQAAQCNLSNQTIAGQQPCSSNSDGEITKSFDGAALPAKSKSAVPIWAYGSCYYFDNENATNGYFIPLNTAQEFDAFVKNTPSDITVSTCNTSSEKVSRGEVIKQAVVATVAALSPANTIVDVAAGNPNFSTLVSLVQAAGLVDTLKSPGPFTVFAPTNAAFAKLPQETLNFLSKPENKQVLISILTYHVLPIKAQLADIAGKRLLVRTVNNIDLRVAGNQSPPRVNQSAIIQTDVMASNGVIHAIDTVLAVPGTIPEKLKNSADFSTLYSLATSSNTILGIIGDVYDVTLFAPTNAAFSALPPALVANITKPENKDVLETILAYHALSFKQKTQDILGQRVTRFTAATRPVLIDATKDPIMVNQSKITYPDDPAKNGTIHVVDKVLMPPCTPIRRSAVIQACPAGQSGSITKVIGLSCPNYDTVETVLRNTCTSNICTPSQSTVTQNCPQGQTGSITITTRKLCDGSNNGQGRTQIETTNNCRTPQSCTPRFLGYRYGSCGVNQYGFIIYSVNRTCPDNRNNFTVLYRACYAK